MVAFHHKICFIINVLVCIQFLNSRNSACTSSNITQFGDTVADAHVAFKGLQNGFHVNSNPGPGIMEPEISGATRPFLMFVFLSTAFLFAFSPSFRHYSKYWMRCFQTGITFSEQRWYFPYENWGTFKLFLFSTYLYYCSATADILQTCEIVLTVTVILFTVNKKMWLNEWIKVSKTWKNYSKNKFVPNDMRIFREQV